MLNAWGSGGEPTHVQQQGTRGMRNMHHFYPRGACYLACMAAGVVLMCWFTVGVGNFGRCGSGCGLEIISGIVCQEQSVPAQQKIFLQKRSARLLAIVLFPSDGMNSFDLQIALVLTFVATVTLLVLSVWWASK